MAWWGWVVSIAGGLTTLGVIASAVPKIARFIRRISHFFDDWFGEPERPGVPARPGVMDRLASTDSEISTINTKLDAIDHELHPNSGSSLRDQVDDIKRTIESQGA